MNNQKSRFELLSEQYKTSKQFKKILEQLSEDEADFLLHDFEFVGRPNQIQTIKETKTIILLQAGRGYGKTFTGAHWLKFHALNGKNEFCNLIAPTEDQLVKVMVEGASGLLNICSNDDRPYFSKSKKQLQWKNGAISNMYSSEAPERLRGPQHYKVWADEVAAWRNSYETYDQAMFGLRLGNNPQMLITSTPKQTKLFKDLQKQSNCSILRGSTYENRSNLASSFFEAILNKYEGSRLGRQEIDAEILDENENALWSGSLIESTRLQSLNIELKRIVIGVDPAVSASQTSDATGIIVAGEGIDGRYYILEDATMIAKPQDWGNKVNQLYQKYKADKVVAEANNGGDLIEQVLRNINPNISYKKVFASRGKIVRAEPISALYEQRKVQHVGIFKKLEDEMTSFSGSDPTQKSPDHLDALVWALTELQSNKNDSLIQYYKNQLKK